jgi:glycosyltransferase involved in cell wall biosynthesis
MSPSLAILICTMNRPRELYRCLTSIAGGLVQPTEVLVSDDSLDGSETAAVCGAFPCVHYFRGPRRGLCANRNAVIDHSSSEFVSLLDDDAVVSVDFVGRAFDVIRALPPRTLVTGTVIEDGTPVVPGNPSFLGFFAQARDGRLRNINLNCNLLPRSAFDEAEFDEMISYGYEDMDLCTRLLSGGYAIRYEPALVNRHLPPPRSLKAKKELFVLAGRARFYTSVKRYLLYERSLPTLLAYVVLAPLHRVLYAARTGRWFDLPNAVTDMGAALRAGFRQRVRRRGRGSVLV